MSENRHATYNNDSKTIDVLIYILVLVAVVMLLYQKCIDREKKSDMFSTIKKWSTKMNEPRKKMKKKE